MKLEAKMRSAAYLGTLLLLVVFAVILFVFTRRVGGVEPFA